MGLEALKLALLIGALHGSITLVAGKCDGVCVRMDECENTFGGINFVNLRFNDEDYEEADCPHYLEVCCDLEHVVTTSAPPVTDHSKESDETDQGKPEVTSEISSVSTGTGDSKDKSSEESSEKDDQKPTTTTEQTFVTDLHVRDNTGDNAGDNTGDNAGDNTGDNAGDNTGDDQTGGGYKHLGGGEQDGGHTDGQNGVQSGNLIGEVDQSKSFRGCGKRNPEGISFRLANSNHNETEFGEFPWMVAILQAHSEDQTEQSSYACGGSLIAPNVILTAAHCVMDKQADQLTVRAGEWDTMTTYEFLPHQERPVSSIILHPKFNRNLLFHDIALLIVAEPFTAADNVQLACLPPKDMDFTSDSCFAAGWGKTAFDAKSYHAILKRVPLPMIDRAQCQTALRSTRLGPRFRLHESFICAGGEEGIDTCTGDGGSPLVCPIEGEENKYYQAGIVAWGINCAQAGIPGVYVRTCLYTDWIDKEVLKHNFGSVDKRSNI